MAGPRTRAAPALPHAATAAAHRSPQTATAPGGGADAPRAVSVHALGAPASPTNLQVRSRMRRCLVLRSTVFGLGAAGASSGASGRFFLKLSRRNDAMPPPPRAARRAR